MIFSDVALSRRLERAEGRTNIDFVVARTQASPERQATWIEAGGAWAMFDGVDSPLTQSFGLGMSEPVTATVLDELEDFFRSRGAAVHHEVSPLADPSALALLTERGYQVIEFTNVLWQPLGPPRPGDPGDLLVDAREARPEEHDIWAATAARGWSEQPELLDFMHELAGVNRYRQNFVPFVGELEGAVIAAGGLSLCDGVAVLAGASTVPEARNQGAQHALLDARLRYALAHGCDLALMGALPGSASQRNAERQGFRIAYTRLKWRLPADATMRTP